MKFKNLYRATLATVVMGIATTSIGVAGRIGTSSKYDNEKIIHKPDTSLLAGPFLENMPRVIAAHGENGAVIYTYDNGKQVIRRGGTRAWRNNNPGCIRLDPAGAIGTAGGFAIFPDEKTGATAIENRLRSDNYHNLTVSAAIAQYAPDCENDTRRYQSFVRRETGVSDTTRIRNLTDEQFAKLVRAIRTMEGWKPGTEIIIAASTARTRE